MVDDVDVLGAQPLGERTDEVVVQIHALRFAEVDFAHRAAIGVDDGDRAAAVAVRREQLAQAGA